MNLGQVFTNKYIAKYMISMISKDKESKILDPCFGKGVFVKVALVAGFKDITGYEIDAVLYKELVGNPEYNTVELKNEDFLSIKGSEKYDAIIMNPPYIRHEAINDLEEIGVNKENLSKDELFNELPANSNMYMYFIVKAMDLLKKDGELVVIFPVTWKNSKVGASFKEVLLKQGSILEEIHVSGDVFDSHVMVDVLILKIKKSFNKTKPKISHVRLCGDKVVETEITHKAGKNEINDLGFSTKLKQITNTRRGLTTGYNKMFMNPPFEENVTNILTSPKSIEGYKTNSTKAEKILYVDSDGFESKVVEEYVEDYKNLILKEKSPKTLYNKILKEDDSWFKFNIFKCEGIIFSYIIRNSTKFVLNEDIGLVRDNFYITTSDMDNLILFALLNNYYTYYQLEVVGKRYGFGLLKVQKYDLDEIFVIDPNEISEKDKAKLRKCANSLIETSDEKYLDEITMIIAKYSNISFEEVKKRYKDLKTNRLGVKNENS